MNGTFYFLKNVFLSLLFFFIYIHSILSFSEKRDLNPFYHSLTTGRHFRRSTSEGLNVVAACLRQRVNIFPFVLTGILLNKLPLSSKFKKLTLLSLCKKLKIALLLL